MEDIYADCMFLKSGQNACVAAGGILCTFRKKKKNNKKWSLTVTENSTADCDGLSSRYSSSFLSLLREDAVDY